MDFFYKTRNILLFIADMVLVAIASAFLFRSPLVTVLVLAATTFSLFLVYEYRIKKFLLYEDIYRTMSRLSQFRELKPLLDYIVHSVTDLLGADRSSLFLLNRSSNLLWTIVAEGLGLKELTISVGQGIVGFCAQTQKVVNIRDCYKDPRFNPEVDRKTGYVTRSLLCAPVFDTKGNLIAVIEVMNKKVPGGFTHRDTDILQLFCSEIGSALTNAQLFESYENLLESLFKAFATAVDARDPATRGHSVRVMRYSINMGKHLGMSELELKTLEYAAILHDVGKIGVPDAILLKAGKFTPEEFEVMKTHALITNDILSKISFPDAHRVVPFIAATHHECLNGTGYPYRLTEERIPLYTRIIAVADIYDALVTYDRPYKEPFPQERALAILRESADQGKLDKKLVEEFITKKLHQIEQRKSVRIDKEFSFSWRRLGQEDMKSLLPIVAKTKDISLGGLKFIASDDLAVNSFVEVELVFPNHTIETFAKVVRCEALEDKTFDIGLMFINLPKETEGRLSKYLTK